MVGLLWTSRSLGGGDVGAPELFGQLVKDILVVKVWGRHDGTDLARASEERRERSFRGQVCRPYRMAVPVVAWGYVNRREGGLGGRVERVRRPLLEDSRMEGSAGSKSAGAILIADGERKWDVIKIATAKKLWPGFGEIAMGQ